MKKTFEMFFFIFEGKDIDFKEKCERGCFSEKNSISEEWISEIIAIASITEACSSRFGFLVGRWFLVDGLFTVISTQRSAPLLVCGRLFQIEEADLKVIWRNSLIDNVAVLVVISKGVKDLVLNSQLERCRGQVHPSKEKVDNFHLLFVCWFYLIIKCCACMIVKDAFIVRWLMQFVDTWWSASPST